MTVSRLGRAKANYAALSDIEVARCCAAGEGEAIRHVITSNNQRLFRTAFGILCNRSEAEDVVQTTYLLAFVKAGSFEGRSSLATWLTRIAANEALGRRRAEKQRRKHLEGDGVSVIGTYRENMMRGSDPEPADATFAREQLRQLLERAITSLPDHLRVVFVLRDVEGLSGTTVGEILDLPEATVKTRLFRARRQLQKTLEPDVASALSGTFPFAGTDCARLTEQVLERLSSEIGREK